MSDVLEEIVYFVWRVEIVFGVGCVYDVDEGDENSEDDGGVDVRR